MVEEIKDLIEKINQEGIIAAKEKAVAIEAAATERADEILVLAQRQAEEMITAATERITRENEKKKALMTQAGRDFLLSLKREVQEMLGRILLAKVRQAMTPEVLSGLIAEVIRNYDCMGENVEIRVFMNEKDLETLETHFLSELGREIKKPFLLMPSGEVSGGFTISFDEGKSYHDFSDKALADYIGRFLKPKLNQILQESVKE